MAFDLLVAEWVKLVEGELNEMNASQNAVQADIWKKYNVPDEFMLEQSDYLSDGFKGRWLGWRNIEITLHLRRRSLIMRWLINLFDGKKPNELYHRYRITHENDHKSISVKVKFNQLEGKISSSPFSENG